ncbi:hypothetical protein KIW84_043984 [Lathyrus oleraceus]|uniref:histidine kinase n=1 Tax=Pisum sativum TaxID=3888 RepID=A0A9D4XJ07_PEA|nr:hypothetical protein KIW84_043984 [Pisum sativum]
MVLILPTDSARKWRDHELELVDVVVDQIAVALSHAVIMEESMRARDQLIEQNVALDLARREAEMEIHARNDFLAVVNHEMRTPMHAIIALSSFLSETELTLEQRVMIETVLKSRNVLAALINDVLDLFRLGDGILELERGKIDLHDVLEENPCRIGDRLCSIQHQVMVISIYESRLRILDVAFSHKIFRISLRSLLSLRVERVNPAVAQLILKHGVAARAVRIKQMDHVSATGIGEAIIRATVTRDVAAIMEFKGLSLKEAADCVVHECTPKGAVGLVAVSVSGEVAMSYNTTNLIFCDTKFSSSETTKRCEK